MTETPFEVIEPLVRAWGRTRSLLFLPFAFERWAIFGFSAWLALWTGAGGGGNLSWLVSPSRPLPESLQGGRDGLSSWFLGLTLALILALASAALLWVLFRTWLQSRFDFVFLDHLVTGETRIAKPWSETAELGHSLFVWRLLLGLGFLVLLTLPIGLALGAGLRPGVMSIGALVLGLLLLGPIVLVGLLLLFAINQFVVPIMARQRVAFQPALAQLRDLLAARPVPFLLYTLLYLVLGVAVGLGITAIGFATCCLGFLVFALPYVGAVVLLPVAVCLRYYSLEFLRQFGPEFDLLGDSPSSEPPPLAAP